ncbi:uncharacterized protein MKZ38_002859 [Zalerion maritima]|uniref:Uncharacterized protein n=1 Tax=Zalerion maritima TaxID=339359 RepID=A0AAD5WX78_9PEZI|nr:uncharacterized protein MKZ38_002859 [Zalerion maritima]
MSFVADTSAIPASSPDFAAPVHKSHLQPTGSQKFIAEHRSPIIGATVASHVAHHQYLSKVQNITSRRVYGVAGVAWAAAYVGVLSATTIAEAKVHKSSCPVENNKN